MNHSYKLSLRSGEVGTSASVIQFPVVVAFCLTCHKVQGQSILYPTRVAIDISSSFNSAMVYVMLSRIQRISQLYICGNFSAKKITSYESAMTAVKNLEAKSMNMNPTPWNSKSPGALRIAALNLSLIHI